MKKTFFYSTVASAVALAISPAIAQETAVLDEVSVVSSGSMYKMGEVPVHQAKSAVAISREDLDKQDVKKADEIGRYQAGFANQVFATIPIPTGSEYAERKFRKPWTAYRLLATAFLHLTWKRSV